MSRAAIVLKDLTLGYRRHPAVHHLSGAFEPGSLTAVAGPNGAGKSTLLKGIMGELKPQGGRVAIEGARPRDIAYLPQISEIDRTFPMSVLDLVSLGVWKKVGFFGGISGRHVEAARQAIAAVGLEGFDDRPISTLSGGQMQRALFARVLVQDASVILLDEPFTAIDAKTQADLLDLVRRWHDEKRTVVAVLHDLDLVRAHFPQTLLIARECVAWGPTAEALSPANLLRARRMGEAFDDAAEICARP